MPKYYLYGNESLIELTDEQKAQAIKGKRDYIIKGDLFGGTQLKVKKFNSNKTIAAQEDRIIAERLPIEERNKYLSLSETNSKNLLHSSFKLINQEILNKIKTGEIRDQGSTGIVAVVESQTGHCMIGNLGDGEVIVVHINKVKEIKFVKTLNTLHQVVEPKEKERLEMLGFPLANNRICGRLEPSRSFGDLKYTKYGLIDEPEIIIYNPELEADEELYYIITSDGIKNKVASSDQPLDNNDIATFIKKNTHLPLEELASQLATEATKRKSYDNISILITKIPSSSESNQVDVYGVFDGHGGCGVSEYIKTAFMGILQSQLNLIVKPETEPPPLDKPTNSATEYKSLSSSPSGSWFIL